MGEIIIQAKRENLNELYVFMDKELGFLNHTVRAELDMMAEEIFVNIAAYAYKGGTGNVVFRLLAESERQEIVMSFQDEGIRYNPLEREDPDIALSVEERGIGGLGIYMVKNMADRVEYQYQFPYNILRIWKKTAEDGREEMKDEK